LGDVAKDFWFQNTNDKQQNNDFSSIIVLAVLVTKPSGLKEPPV
jgi:hypothetical protein